MGSKWVERKEIKGGDQRVMGWSEVRVLGETIEEEHLGGEGCEGAKWEVFFDVGRNGFKSLGIYSLYCLCCLMSF